MRAALWAVAVFALWVASPASAALSWSSPVLIDQTDSTTQTAPFVTAVECPSRSLCVAFAGNVVSSNTRPGRGGAWSAPRPEFPRSMARTPVACPSASRCVAISGSGQVAVSRHPASDDWRLAGTATLPSFDFVTGLSCPSVSLCVAVDFAGDVISSRHPFGSVSSWTVTAVEPGLGVTAGRGLSAVSCPGVKLCVVADDRGNVLTSTNPTGGASAWRAGQVLPDREVGGFPNGLVALSCASTSACLGVNRNGDIADSRDPAAGASSWTVIHDGAATELSTIVCVSASLCVAIGRQGVFWSRNPTSRGPRWTRGEAFPPGALIGGGGISCPSPSLCIVGDGQNLAVSVKPTGGSSAWKLIQYHFSQALEGISCPTAALCVTADSGGGVVVSTVPSAHLAHWRRFQVVWNSSLYAVSCPSPKLCVAGGDGGLLTSSHPARGASAWKQTLVSNIGTVSCPSVSLCVGAGYGGDVIVSTDPTGGVRAWHSYIVDAQNYYCGDSTCQASITGISCPTTSFCVGVDVLGNTFISTAPDGGPSSWTAQPADLGSVPSAEPSTTLAVSCPSTQLCVVVGPAGEVETSTNPTGDASAWTHTDLHDPAGITGVSCRTVFFCVAVDAAGNAFTSTNPTGGAPAWHRSNINRSIPLNAVSCATRSLCVAVDSYGYATVSR